MSLCEDNKFSSLDVTSCYFVTSLLPLESNKKASDER